MASSRFTVGVASIVSVALLCAVGAAPAHALTDVNLDAVAAQSDSGITLTLNSQSVADNAAEAMPDNPTKDLPDSVSSKISDDATVVSEDYALTEDGELKELSTGKTVTDPTLVGTATTQPDPLAKTNGESFIPVSVGEVRDAMSETGDSASASAAGSATSSASKTDGVVRFTALQGNEYGAYWGTFNGTSAFFNKSGKLFAQQAKGVVDVSAWQQNIDWEAAQRAGVEGAIIRLGYGWENAIDNQAIYNIKECKRLGIPFGVYWYSYAYDARFGAGEGKDVVEKLKEAGVEPSDLSYPIYYDLEAYSWAAHPHPTKPAVYEEIVNAWYAQLQAAGYTNLGVYSYTSYLNSALKSSMIYEKTSWVAQYGPTMQFDSFGSNERGWQYTSQGAVNGIPGAVDLNAFGNAQICGGGSSGNTVAICRVYNPNSGLHHYTASYDEAVMLVAAGWRDEGAAFKVGKSGTPVYREYNPNDGNHNWTMSGGEHAQLVALGWHDEGTSWYVSSSDPVAVYRLYNPNSGEHIYTTSYGEYEAVGAAGWRQEGVAWKARS
ncbi:1,4-beta-N-acetylmuramidase [Bifidobacterium goeldii]|uniref:1,4-beta-N-acetylmuramidase n=1 Tax=Bifidobacterium goeldii TaxID=2306975 RepID=A0A430FEQ8_9BIFI|nr:glycoside hydrolase family 25 protein [Bifidobacterium goeldii]RSX51385.1 1,4-beta-N-acetylmuramidase [Bifidobacterium goeldii]